MSKNESRSKSVKARWAGQAPRQPKPLREKGQCTDVAPFENLAHETRGHGTRGHGTRASNHACVSRTTKIYKRLELTAGSAKTERKSKDRKPMPTRRNGPQQYTRDPGKRLTPSTLDHRASREVESAHS